MKLKDIMGELYSIYNPKSAEEWDNVGLIIGDENKEINKVLFCLDLTLDVVNEAINQNVNLIITHHPAIFSGVKRITNESIQGEKLLKIIENNISVYSIHTNSDFAINGLNDFIMEKIGLDGRVVISGEREYEDYNPIKKIVEKHKVGQTRIKYLEKEITLEQLIEKIKIGLGLDCVRYVGDKSKLVSRIGLVTGGGISLIYNIKDEIDVFLTGDLKHHESLDLYEEGKLLIDIGHYESEYLFVELMKREMSKFFDGEMIEYYGKPVFQIK